MQRLFLRFAFAFAFALQLVCCSSTPNPILCTRDSISSTTDMQRTPPILQLSHEQKAFIWPLTELQINTLVNNSKQEGIRTSTMQRCANTHNLRTTFNIYNQLQLEKIDIGERRHNNIDMHYKCLRQSEVQKFLFVCIYLLEMHGEEP